MDLKYYMDKKIRVYYIAKNGMPIFHNGIIDRIGIRFLFLQSLSGKEYIFHIPINSIKEIKLI